MTIQQFSKIQAEGLFQDFSWPSGIEDFSQMNLIYAWNGTGKTTLSRLMKEFGKDSNANNTNIEIKVEDKRIPASKLDAHGYQIKVFNSDYISNSIKEVKKGTAEPIYFIGEGAAEIQNKLTDIKDKLTVEEEAKSNNEDNCNIAKDDLENFFTSKAFEIKDALRKTRIGQLDGKTKYYDYEKPQYKKSLIKLLKENTELKSYTNDLDSLLEQLVNSNESIQNTDETLTTDSLWEKINVSQKKSYDTFTQELPDLALIENEINDILKEGVIRNSLENLLNDRDKENWTEKGLIIYNSQNSDNCPWCFQNVPQKRIADLESHFNDSFKQLTTKINTCLSSIDSNSQKLSDALEFCDAERDLYPEVTNAYELAKKELSQEIKTAEEWFVSISADIDKKLANMANSLDITDKAPNITFNSIQSINNAINKHNQKCEDHDKDIKSAAEKYIDAAISNEITEIKRRKKMELEHCKLIAEKEKEICKLKKRIEELQEDAKNAEIPIQELNSEINDFFGHSEIKFVASDKGYILHRGNDKISKLSDGETSIIALLYFLKSLKSEEKNTNKVIVVIDDPVSSMDSSNLFRAATFISKRIVRFQQVFIFTHNFVLFRQALNAAKNDFQDKVNPYILNAKIVENGVRRTTIASLPKALKVYYSEYHFLFESILNVSKDEISSLEWHYNLPNMARRLLESFLSFKFPNDKEQLTILLRSDKIVFDGAKKESLIKFLHSYSHKGTIFDHSQEENKISEARGIVKDLIDLIKCLDEEHYNGMVKSLE